MSQNIPSLLRNEPVLMPFYLPGTPRYVQALQLFLSHTNEYEVFRPWYLQFLQSLTSKRYFLEIGVGDGSSLTQDTDQHFQLGIAIEKNVSLLPTICENCPNTRVIGKPIEDVDDQEIRTLLAKSDYSFSNKEEGEPIFDLIQLVHLLYYFEPEDRKNLFRRLAKQVRPGGVIFAALQDETSDYFSLYHQLTPHTYNLRKIGEWFQSEFKDWQVTTEDLPGKVTSDSLDTAQQMTEFALCLLPFSPLPPRLLITQWIKDTLWQADSGLYVANNPQRIIVCHRMY
jgi:SAM-dependent methyltransferase